MSFGPVSISSVLDRLQSWGDAPVVNPVKGRGRARLSPPTTPETRAHPIAFAVVTFVALAAILIVSLLTTSTSGFIYAQF